jgi:hypothetical protein
MPSTFAATDHQVILGSSLLHSSAFTVLSAFVLINTVMFLALAILKLMPKLHISDWITSRNRRAETRSIHPDLPDADQPATGTRPAQSRDNQQHAEPNSAPPPSRRTTTRLVKPTNTAVTGHASGIPLTEDDKVFH